MHRRLGNGITGSELKRGELTNEVPICSWSHAGYGWERLVGFIQRLRTGSSEACDTLSGASGQSGELLKGLLQHASAIEHDAESGTQQYRSGEQRVLGATECNQLMQDGTPAGGLAPSTHLGFVATYQADVILDPLESGALVVQAGIGKALLFHSVAGEETVGADLGTSILLWEAASFDAGCDGGSISCKNRYSEG